MARTKDSSPQDYGIVGKLPRRNVKSYLNISNFNSGICPNGSKINNVSWRTIVQAGSENYNTEWQDWSGDGKIDVADIVYFLA